MKLTQVISEKTLIPISAVSVLIGAVAWATTVHNLTYANAALLEKVANKQETEQASTADAIQAIKTDLAVIKSELQQMNRRKNGSSFGTN